jgi:hypothetical protein
MSEAILHPNNGLLPASAATPNLSDPGTALGALHWILRRR